MFIVYYIRMSVAKSKHKVQSKPKKRIGPPLKYKPEFNDQVLILSQKGFTDLDIAETFGVTEMTINNWKKKYPQFFESMKAGKSIADKHIVQSLYQKALGYSHPDLHISVYEGDVTKTEVIKHHAPDTTACIFWLKNRQRDQWSDRVIQSHEVDKNTATLLGMIDGSSKGQLPTSEEAENAG